MQQFVRDLKYDPIKDRKIIILRNEHPLEASAFMLSKNVTEKLKGRYDVELVTLQPPNAEKVREIRKKLNTVEGEHWNKQFVKLIQRLYELYDKRSNLVYGVGHRFSEFIIFSFHNCGHGGDKPFFASGIPDFPRPSDKKSHPNLVAIEIPAIWSVRNYIRVVNIPETRKASLLDDAVVEKIISVINKVVEKSFHELALGDLNEIAGTLEERWKYQDLNYKK